MKWEYLTSTRGISQSFTSKELNTLGEGSWELCGCFTSVLGVHHIFKRPYNKDQPLDNGKHE